MFSFASVFISFSVRFNPLFSVSGEQKQETGNPVKHKNPIHTNCPSNPHQPNANNTVYKIALCFCFILALSFF